LDEEEQEEEEEEDKPGVVLRVATSMMATKVLWFCRASYLRQQNEKEGIEEEEDLQKKTPTKKDSK
jgi:hypothetical protein|tara:strand:+ start:300 stop:497 length:198 start_codon:yes stop_codon:yes gene_type:complete